jgi:hypothetical protein
MEEVRINTRKWRIINKSIEKNYNTVTKVKIRMVWVRKGEKKP